MRNNYICVRYSIRGRRRWGWQTRFVSLLSSALDLVLWYLKPFWNRLCIIPQNNWNMKVFRILFPSCFSDSWFLACFTIRLLETPFVFVIFVLNHKPDCFFNQSCFPLDCEVFRVQKSIEQGWTPRPAGRGGIPPAPHCGEGWSSPPRPVKIIKTAGSCGAK